ncbi:MAG TPA: HPr(Ser) kinase/phosphatase [Polyangiaceae bacterium LLY-WYZ-14_1]|jgi:HPr kinase/phosphorylase|nr:HPr(Ser) kinase/phosphatase [Polyangiaceae bacterium LLY-WYZ-14_1]
MLYRVTPPPPDVDDEARPSTTVRALAAASELADLLTLQTGADGLDRRVAHPRIQKSGLALAGHLQGIAGERVQILGETELTFLDTLPTFVRRQRVAAFFELGLCVVLVTRGLEPPPEVLDEATRTGTPLFTSPRRSSQTINAVHLALDRMLAPQTTMHGVLVDVHAVGVLLLGPSGIGKSECALFLVERGHRLVADDQVELRRDPKGRLLGRAAELLKNHLEVRGLGILNVRDLFGAPSVREEAPVDLAVELCRWREDDAYERLGLDEPRLSLLGVRIPKLRIPVHAGRDMGVLLEVAARNELLKRAGLNAARRFADRVDAELGGPVGESGREGTA